jgi:hypothetical protein
MKCFVHACNAEKGFSNQTGFGVGVQPMSQLASPVIPGLRQIEYFRVNSLERRLKSRNPGTMGKYCVIYRVIRHEISIPEIASACRLVIEASAHFNYAQ